MNRQIAAMTHAAITADFNQPLDVQLLFAAQVALHHEVFGNIVTQSRDFGIRQILDAGIGVDFGLCQNLAQAGQANPVEIGQPDFDALVAGRSMPSIRAIVIYPCRCLCLGFSQMTYSLPLRLTILHLAQRLRMDGETLISAFLLTTDTLP